MRLENEYENSRSNKKNKKRQPKKNEIVNANNRNGNKRKRKGKNKSKEKLFYISNESTFNDIFKNLVKNNLIDSEEIKSIKENNHINLNNILEFIHKDQDNCLVNFLKVNRPDLFNIEPNSNINKEEFTFKSGLKK